MKNKRTVLFIICLSVVFLSCGKKEILFIHDQYYPYLFENPDSWEKDLKRTASGKGFSLEFLQIDVGGNLPEIDIHIENSSKGFIMTSPIFSSKIKYHLQNNQNGKIFLDLDPTGNALNSSHIILPCPRDAIFHRAGIITGEKANALGSDAAGFFLTDSAERRNEMNSFLEGFRTASKSRLITKEFDNPETSPIDLSEIPGAVQIYFISTGQFSAKTAMETVTDKYIAGEYINSIYLLRENIIFSIEYDPVYHFRQLLGLFLAVADNSLDNINADYFKIKIY